jgi:hypothetical protein
MRPIDSPMCLFSRLAIALIFLVAGMATGQQSPAPTAANPQTRPPEVKAPETSDKNAPSTDSKKHRKRPAPSPDGSPRKIVVREGGASEPAAQIAPDISPAEATRQRQNSEQLLGSTDRQLKRLAGRNLDVDQQQTVGQIHNYMDGARAALKEGDVRRASTLSEKAYLLAEDLAKH